MGTSTFINLQTKFQLRRDVLATNSVFQKPCWYFFSPNYSLVHAENTSVKWIIVGSNLKRRQGWERGGSTVEGGYFMATHCTTAVAGLSQMCVRTISANGGLWENLGGWAHSGTMTGKTTNRKHMAYWYQVLSLAWNLQS